VGPVRHVREERREETGIRASPQLGVFEGLGGWWDRRVRGFTPGWNTGGETPTDWESRVDKGQGKKLTLPYRGRCLLGKEEWGGG